MTVFDRRPPSPRLGLLCAVLLLALGATACSDDSSGSGDKDSAGTPTSGSATDNDPGAGNATDAPLGDDETSLIALSKATLADSGEWRGDVMVLHFSEGSVGDPKAQINCSVIGQLLPDGKGAELNYPDGVLDCADVWAARN